jgi:YVTN family beta-propeller protein
MALGMVAGFGHGQWLETKITLPDSLGGATGPICFTTDTSERYVYIADQSGAIYVVDAEARTRVAKIPASCVSAVCTNTRRNKVYAADYTGNRVLAMSCATNQVVATIPTGARPFAICYNSADDKMYVASYMYGGSDSLTVIDCSSDSAVATMHVGQGQPSLCYNPAANRVFCASYDTLRVVDGAGDSVVAAYAGEWWRPMAVDAVANKVYASASGIGILVLDGTTGIVLDSLQVGADVMCLNSRTQKLYTCHSSWDDLLVFDCAADTLVARLRRVGEGIRSIACDTATGKVYAAWDGLMLVIDGVADTISAEIPGPYRGELLVSSKWGRAYCTDHHGPGLAVYDTGTDSLLRTIFIGGMPTEVCYDSIDDKVYYASYSVLGEVGAIDAATNQPVGHTQVGSYPQSVVWHAPTNRVYCGGTRDITVIDPTADTATKVLPVQGAPLGSAPGVNKVYAFDTWDYELAVIDCRNDSVVKTIPVPTEVVWSMCYVAYDKLYVGGYGGVAIIDCVKDTLIRSYPFAWSRLVAGPEGKLVYCWRPSSLCTFDPAGDTLVAEVPWVAGSALDLLYAPGADKVYCAAPGNGPCGAGCVLVANGVADSIIAEIPLRMAWALGYDSASGLVCCSQGWDSTVTFIDSRTDSMVGSLNSGLYPLTFVTAPAHSRVYAGGWGDFGLGSCIPVIRTNPPGVEEAVLSRRNRSVGPTLVSRSSPLVVHRPSVLLDATGRKVSDVKPGLHDLIGCRVGIYFLRDFTDGLIVKIVLVD